MGCPGVLRVMILPITKVSPLDAMATTDPRDPRPRRRYVSEYRKRISESQGFRKCARG
ncbi:unnamed protein product [Cladocopium goreaui]|uniref:Uncharacterized protein n=1 Tax=Cladocopium goreaui TaxID=2562237 RepID=A0A9P1GPA7_9DINO|nr:unnamed protein product [Cladocopium goreaui]